MDKRDAVQTYLEDRGLGEVPVCDMDRQRFLLVGANGRRYHEVATNIWAETEPGFDDVVYLSTGRHGGGITLRPLFVRVGGRWLNAGTGREAPVGLL